MRRFVEFAKRRFKAKSQKPLQDSGQCQPATGIIQHNVLTSGQQPMPIAGHQPTIQVPTAAPVTSTTTPTLQIALVNRTSSNKVYAYVTGLASSNNNALFLLQSDGITGYYPTSPASTIQPLQRNCAIQLGAPGSTTMVTIPQIAGGRIWFSVDNTLTFFLNPGPALVEPSVTNQSDPNVNINWAFAEFTFNSTQIYANISYVDFVSVPISLGLIDGNNATQTVTGMPSNGLANVCTQLRAQSTSDGVAGWSNCIVRYNGNDLRALSPNNSMLLNPYDFQGYWEPYVDQVWQKYSTSGQGITVNAGNINATGSVTGTQLNLSGELFDKPTTKDVFSANTGPFTTGADGKRNQLIPQLAAAFNRSTLLQTNITPTTVDQFYKNPITNHYSRICHANNVDGLGYGFPYDDVAPAGGQDQSGYVSGANPKLLTVIIGGGQYS
jgi:hypothetical protein